MNARVCLISTGQPSTNPRLVKEADALTSQGYAVHVIGAHWTDWADRADVDLLKGRAWSAEIIDWRQDRAAWLFWKSRVRHRAARALFSIGGRASVVGAAAVGRLTPELTAAAVAKPADLYIAHNLGALPAAAIAARHHSARLGFDAEDYHAGQFADDEAASTIARAIEREYLPRCDYVTAASPAIASTYVSLCQAAPTVVLNVFPLADRPVAPVPSRGGPLRLYWFSQTIGRGRGLEQAVRAMGEFPDGAVELHVRGDWQPGFRGELEAAAHASGVKWNCVTHHAPASPSEMVRLAAEFDAGLALEPARPANADMSLSNKLFTYLLAGVPVIASATTAQTELMRHFGEAGAIVPIGNSGAIAGVLRRWIDDPPALESARRTAWLLGESRYNWDREQLQFLDRVRSVVPSPQRGVPEVRGRAS